MDLSSISFLHLYTTVREYDKDLRTYDTSSTSTITIFFSVNETISCNDSILAFGPYVQMGIGEVNISFM
ncbi:MAG: hypothetical protein HUJ51_03785 [Eggerthellaceae bacterium]|nr:hypothetical protein [Eggerthellaceae bacterium]